MKETPKAAETLDKLIAAFDSGTVAEAIAHHAIPRDPNEAPRPCDAWSLNNNLLLWIQGTEDARGFRQWQEIGRQVKKGSKAIHILIPLVGKKKDAAPDDADAIQVYGFKACPVFAMEDTEGEPIHAGAYEPPAPPPLANVAEAWAIPIHYAPREGNYLGAYQFNAATNATEDTRQRIKLCSHDETVFFHELAHAADRRANPAAFAEGKRGQDPAREAVADLAAAVLARVYLDKDASGTAYKYLKNYGDPRKLAHQVSRRTLEAIRLIMETAAEATAAAA